MLGTRGARLGLLLPGLYEMQVRALIEAAVEASAVGDEPQVEIMVPLIAYESELVVLRELVDHAVSEVTFVNRDGRPPRRGRDDDRASTCLPDRRQDRRARRVLQFRHQRPDPNSPRVLSRRRRARLPARVPLAGLVAKSPFETIDTEGVGELAEDGRGARSRDQAWAEAWNLRRARGGPGQHRVLPRRRPRLRQLLPVPGADCAGRCRPSRDWMTNGRTAFRMSDRISGQPRG